MRVLYFHERAGVSGSTISLALSVEALGSEIEPWIVTPRGPAADLLGSVGRVLVAPSAGLLHAWSGIYRGARWSVLGAHAAALPRHLIAARSIMRRVRPDVVHVNDSAQLPVAELARRLGLPVVVHLRLALPETLGSWRSEIARRAVARADVAVAINEDIAESFGRPPNTVVVPNPVRVPDTYGGDPQGARSALGLSRDRPVIGFIGHFLRSKGCHELLEAVAKLVASGGDVEVVLVGSSTRSREWHRSVRGRVLGALADRGDVEAEIRDLVERLGLRDRVTMLGWREDLSTVYDAVDLLCAPSQGPELTRPVLEAQARGRAVVAVSRTGGGIVDNEVNGLLVDQAEPDQLARAIGRLVNDPALRGRLGKAARDQAEREYALGVVAGRLKGVYAQACGLPDEEPAVGVMA